MKKLLIFAVLIILGNRTIAQNYTEYPCFNCVGSIMNLYTDTTNNTMYVNGLIWPMPEVNNYANSIVGFNNGQFLALAGFPASNSIASCRYNGTLYVAGQFYSPDSTDNYHLVKWDGMQATPVIVQGQAFNLDIGNVNRIEILNNELYIAGGFRFTDSDGIMANGIAKLVNGEFKSIHNFPQWRDGINNVDCISMFNNELYVGGRITDTSPLDTMKYICKWNGTNWQMLGNGISGSFPNVRDMEVFQGKLYVAGCFSDPGKNLAIWNGNNWEETEEVFTTEVAWGGEIHDLQVYNDELYIGGYFNTVAGIPASNFAKFDGNEWCTFLNDSLGEIVMALEVYNNELYLAGSLVKENYFSELFPYPFVNTLVKINTVGTIYTCIDVVSALSEQQKNDDIVIVPNPTNGLFELKNATEVHEISILDVSGKVVREFENISSNEVNKIDISDLPSGFYHLRILSNSASISSKLIKN